MAELRSKSNKKFMVLSAIGIFMVVDHHTFTALNMFGDFIPYNSFFMPMFVFISGYFNKVDGSTNLLKYFVKKLRTLLLPYLIVSLIVLALQELLNWIKLGETPSIPSWFYGYALERIVTVGAFTPIATPMWFVISLFSVLIVYALLKKLLSMLKIWNSFVMLVLFTAMSLFAVWFAKNYEFSEYLLVPLKVMFLIPFLEMGSIYKNYLEKPHTSMPAGGKIGLLTLCLLINMVRTMYLPQAYDVAFDSIDDLSGFTSPYIVTPIVSSIVGIAFWLTIVDLIGKPFYESRFVNYMSCNTFWIMGLHITFYNILNLILLLISENITPLLYFDTEYFRESEWYYWEISPAFKFAYVVVGILGPLGLKWICDRIYLLITKPFKKKKAPDKAVEAT